jgi:hypothetical protein
MTPPASRNSMVWNDRLHRWEPAGMVWDRRLCRWVPQPQPADRVEVDKLTSTIPQDADGDVDGPVADGGAPEPEGPSRGPRVCKQRTRRKRIGAGSRAYQPTRDGKPMPKTKRVRWAFPKAALSS